MTNETIEIVVSAASAWEIATKVRLGKLPEGKALEQRFVEALDEIGYTLLPIDARSPSARGVSPQTTATHSIE